MCNFSDETKFQETWNRTIWLTVDICIRYSFDPTNINQLNTHAWVSETWHETDHTDPIGYFQQHGKTWDDFVNDVRTEILLIGGDDMSMPVYEDWMGQKGAEAINKLTQILDINGKPLIQNPESHISNVSLATPQWLFWVMLSRMAK